MNVQERDSSDRTEGEVMGILVICFDNAELNWIIKKYQNYPEWKTKKKVIVSPDYRIYNNSSLNNSGYMLLPMEERKSIVELRENVYKYIDAINSWFNIKESSYLYKVTYQIEGGIQTDIFSIICWIDYFTDVIQAYSIDKIIYVNNSKYGLLRMILRLISQQQHVEMKEYKKYRILMQFESGSIGAIHSIAQLFKIILLYIRHIFTTKEKREYRSCFAGILMCSNSNKHISWTLPMLKELSKHGESRVICVHADETAQRLKNMGYSVDVIEKNISLKEMIKCTIQYRTEVKHVCDNVHDLGCFEENNCNFYSVLYKVIREYLNVVVYRRYLLNVCFNNYLEKHDFKVIREWGSMNFEETVICYNNTLKRRMDTIYMQETFLYSWNFYFKEVWIDDYRFVSDKAYLEYYLTQGKERNHCFFINSPIFVRKYIANKKLQKSLHRKEKTTFLYAPSYPMIGYTRLGDYVINNNEIIKFFVNNAKGYLYIKNHPNDKRENVKCIAKQIEHIDNITLLPQNYAIEDALSMADVIITDVSTVIWDAIVAEKPVICLARGIDIKRLVNVECIMYDDIGRLCKHLERLILDSSYAFDWIAERVEKQNLFFENNYINPNASLEPEREIAYIILNVLSTVRKKGK